MVGGGIIGLSIAREVAANGHSVLLLERGETGEGASWAAAGMLAPQSEADQSGPFYELCAASQAMYRGWAGRLQQESGVDLEYVESGLLFLAPTEACLSALQQRTGWQRAAGLPLTALSEEETRELEPSITMPLAGALLMPNEHQVTPRRVAQALRAMCKVDIRTSEEVHEIMHDGRRVTGVRTDKGVIPASIVVLAAGAWTAQIQGLQPQIPVSPRKGQILSLGMPGRTFRHMVRWGRTYAVPRPNGELIVGATVEDVGFDRNLTPAGVGQLLNAVQEMSKDAARYPIHEMWTGLRPSTPDELPVLGCGRLSGLIYATGHYRNGVLLAPITAAIVADLIEDRVPSISLDAFTPMRQFEV